MTEQDWIEAYKAIADKIATDHPEVKMIDLWNDQPYYEEPEYPLPPFAVFLEFSASEIVTLGNGAQKVPLSVEVVLYYETLGDSHLGSSTQDHALAFAGWLRKLHQTLHGFSGEHFSDLTRIAFGKKPSVNGARVYSQTFETVVMDYGANTGTEVQDNTGQAVNVNVQKGEEPASEETAIYQLD